MNWSFKESLAIIVSLVLVVALLGIAAMAIRDAVSPKPSSSIAQGIPQTPQTYSRLEEAAYALAKEQDGFIQRHDLAVTRLTYLLRSIAQLARGGYSEIFAERTAQKIAAGWRYVRYTCGVNIKLLEFTEAVVSAAYAFSQISDEDVTAIVATAGIYICHGGK